MKTELSSKAQVLDLRYLTITDFSTYNTDIPVTSSIYRITVPNFNQYVDIPYTPGTAININSNLLNLTATRRVSGLACLPSGLWIINHSVCPNDKVFIEYYFFNIAPDLKELANAVCCNKEDEEIIDKLWDIKQSFELAKILAEDCGDTKKAIALYNQAAKQLANLTCEC